ncbi:MAG: tetratricopeptide repeat protein [Promethearchaeota archaeon]
MREQSKVRPKMAEEIENLLKNALELFNDAQYTEAIEIFESLVEKRVLGPDPHFGMAECLQALGRYEESLDSYDKALELDEENDLFWNGKGVSLFYLREYGKAKMCFDVAFDLNDENLTYLLSSAEMSILVGYYKEARELARKALDKAQMTSDIVMSWAFSILAYLFDGKIVSAIETLIELVRFLEETVQDLLPENDFKGTDYDFSGLEEIIKTGLRGASLTIMSAFTSYLHGKVPLDGFEAILHKEKDNISIEDLILVPRFKGQADSLKTKGDDYPDIDSIEGREERETLEYLDSLVEDFEGNTGFMSFSYLFSIYDWNADRGPAPFIIELENHFFVDIEAGAIRKIALDVDILKRALVSRGNDAGGRVFLNKLGTILNYPKLDELYISCKSVSEILELLRAGNLGKQRELYVIMHVEIPEGEDSLSALELLERAPEAWEIDEIPADYQDDRDVQIFSMKWRVS